MSEKEICIIVCDCLARVTIPPAGTTQEQCEQQSTSELALDSDDITRLLMCIQTKLHERRCFAPIGPADWEQSATVGEFCGSVHAKHSCPDEP